MSDLEQRLRADLHAAADGLTELEPLDGPSLRAASLGRRGVGRLVIALAVAAALIGAVALVSTRYFLSGIPTSGPALSSWEPRGDADLVATLGARAQAVWEASLLPPAELPHRSVRPIFAAHTEAGDVVVLEGTDALGHHRVAVFGTDVLSRTPYRDRLHLLSDKPAPGDSRLIAWDLPRPTPRPSDDRLLVVLAPPDTERVTWREQEEGAWHQLVTPDGTGVVLHATRGLDSFVRVGSHGRGLRIPMALRLPDHVLDDEEYSDRGGDENCNSQGECSIGTGGIVTATPSDGGTADLRDGGAVDEATHKLRWEEMRPEVELGTQRQPRAGSWFGSTVSSGLLPDGTGLLLQSYSINGGAKRFALYVDHPRLPVGAFWWDQPIDGPTPAVSALIGRPAGGRWVAAVAAPLVRLQVRVGDGSWQTAAARGDLRYLAVPATGSVAVRLVDNAGSVLREGTVDTTGPITR